MHGAIAKIVAMSAKYSLACTFLSRRRATPERYTKVYRSCKSAIYNNIITQCGCRTSSNRDRYTNYKDRCLRRKMYSPLLLFRKGNESASESPIKLTLYIATCSQNSLRNARLMKTSARPGRFHNHFRAIAVDDKSGFGSASE